jgi:hypothetical protein
MQHYTDGATISADVKGGRYAHDTITIRVVCKCGACGPIGYTDAEALAAWTKGTGQADGPTEIARLTDENLKLVFRNLNAMRYKHMYASQVTESNHQRNRANGYARTINDLRKQLMEARNE